MAHRLRAEMDGERRRDRPMHKAQPRERYMGGPIFDAPDGYEPYPLYESPRVQAQPREIVRPAKRDAGYTDRARVLVAQMPLNGNYANSPKMDLFGPTVREAPAYRNPEHPKAREIRAVNGNRDSYRFVKNIGAGGQGYCDLYQRTSDKKFLVCKVMGRPSTSTTSKPTEVSILIDILEPHPRLISLKHWSETATATILWYEYCALGDLHDLIHAYSSRCIPIPESFIWHTFIQLADAFAYMHTGYDRLCKDPRPPKGFRPVIHRDVKPANVFLRPNPSAPTAYPSLVLADFGCATTKLLSGENYTIGTPVYQPPEVPIHTAHSDIWALGACIHEMATGSPPIRALPRNWDGGLSEWYEEPSARMVANLTRFGYSRELDEAMWHVLRSRAADRLVGRELVKMVRRLYEEWGGKREKLASWAFGG
ncbi:MAG: hypothetical protein Q9219_006795 [cf. Caloplaca sp. 3 TL-2023]